MDKSLQSTSVRLNKFLARHLNLGRRQADELILAGEVLVNGRRAILGAQIDPGSDKVTVNGRLLSPGQADFIYLLLNKPAGYVCSRRQQGNTPTIYTLLPQKYHHLKPAGRLDKDSSGLLLLTNDGDFAHKMTHPSFQKTKVYEVSIDKPLTPLHRQIISDHGVLLSDGPSTFELERAHGNGDKDWRIIMREGRNRQIRRTFSALGYEVTRLHRILFGPFSLGTLMEGDNIITNDFDI